MIELLPTEQRIPDPNPCRHEINATVPLDLNNYDTAMVVMNAMEIMAKGDSADRDHLQRTVSLLMKAIDLKKDGSSVRTPVRLMNSHPKPETEELS